MRLALVQLGRGYPPLAQQIEALKAFDPHAYHVEEGVNIISTRRMMERLEQLQGGDSVVITALDVLRPDLGAALNLCAELLARGVSIEVVGEGYQPIRLGESPRDAAVIGLFSALNRRRQSAPVVGQACLGDQDLLTGGQVEEIRRLHRAGLSPRRIGLIFRRSPKAIAAILRQPDDGKAGPRAKSA
jgi:hypothetical protein